MAAVRTVRRSIMAVVVVAAGGFAVTNPGTVRAFFDGIYPSDSAKRQALDLCFREDHKFNRLDSDERETCYRHTLMSLGSMSAVEQPNANLVDLQRAADQGSSLPRNDVRRVEQTQGALHSPH
jgi:hypothetical protein